MNAGGRSVLSKMVKLCFQLGRRDLVISRNCRHGEACRVYLQPAADLWEKYTEWTRSRKPCGTFENRQELYSSLFTAAAPVVLAVLTRNDFGVVLAWLRCAPYSTSMAIPTIFWEAHYNWRTIFHHLVRCYEFAGSGDAYLSGSTTIKYHLRNACSPWATLFHHTSYVVSRSP